MPGDFQRGQTWEAFSHGTPFLEGAARLLLLANAYLIAFIIQMTCVVVNGMFDGVRPPVDQGGACICSR
jgi:hypothetical protein